MKSIFLGLSAIAAMLFASCAQDELVSNEAGSGDEIVATFELTTPQGIQTRAIGDGTSADVVACAVYDAAGNELEALRNNELTVSGKKATYSIRLVKGQSYRVAFFAYNKAAAAYDVTDMKNIKVKDSQKSNIEARDAFTAYIDVTASETMNAVKKEVRLYRPFAQLNLGSVVADIEAAKKAGIVVKNTKVTVENMYTAFSAYQDEVVGGTSTQVFEMNAQPTDALSANGETYDYLALNYILVGDTLDPKALTTVTFEWEAENGYKNSPATEFNNVPVQRNYRTNILGYLLTNPAEFNIVIDEEFKKPDHEYIIAGGTEANPAPLEDAMDEIATKGIKDAVINVPAGTYVSWTTEGGIGSSPFVEATNGVTETITIQGDGASSVFVATGAGVGALRAANGAKVIFKDITVVDESVSYAEDAWEFTYLEFAGNLEFNNVTFKGGIQLETAANDVTLNAQFTNCTFITEESSVYAVWVCDGTAKFDNCKFQGTRGLKMHEDYGSNVDLVTVDGCEFGPLSEKPGIAIGDLDATTVVKVENSSFIGCQAGDQGKYIYESDTDVNSFTFTLSNNSVVEDPSKVVMIGTKAELVALANDVNVNGNGYGGKIIKLTADIDLEGMDWEPIGQTGGNGVATHFTGSFDGQGHTISNFVITNTGTYDKGGNYAAGLFGFVDAGDAVISNLNVDNATVNGHHWSAVIVGYLTGSVQNCHVTNSSVTCTHYDGEACGDKAGAIVGYTNHSSTTVKNCSATTCTITASRDAGQIVGCNSNGVVVSGCSAINVTVSAAGDCTGANIKNEIVGRQN